MSKKIGFLIVVLLVIVDLVSKNLIFKYVPLHESITIIKNFIYIKPVYNTGAGFSILEGKMGFLIAISSLASILFIYLMKDCDFKKRPLYSVAIVLILAGTLGNLWDRAIYYKVRDFIYPNPQIFPANFNFADSCLSIGVIIMCIYFLFYDHKQPISFLPKRYQKSVDSKTTEVTDE